jgi:replicative DNA helicase
MLLENTDEFTYLLAVCIHKPDLEGKKVLNSLVSIWDLLPPYVAQIVEGIQDVYSKPVKVSAKAVWDYCNSRKYFQTEMWLRNIATFDVLNQWEYKLGVVMSTAKRFRIKNAFARVDLDADLDSVIKQIGDLSKFSKYDESFFSDLAIVHDEILGGKRTKKITTGFRQLDSALDGGFPVGDVSVIAGSTGSGKSAFVLNSAFHALRSGETQVTIYSLEMTARTIFQRLASIASGVSPKYLGGCDISKRALDYLKTQYFEGNLRIRGATTSISQIRNQALVDSKWGEKAQMVIVDYTGLVDHKAKSSYERMSEISRELRQIALDANCAMIEVVQLNREYKKQQDTAQPDAKRPPILTDLRDSGQIEQDASVILMLHTPPYESDTEWKPMEAYLRKNRDGQNEQRASLEFRGASFQFKEIVHY